MSFTFYPFPSVNLHFLCAYVHVFTYLQPYTLLVSYDYVLGVKHPFNHMFKY